MGLDMKYQAIPDGCGLIELAREAVDDPEGLAMLPIWLRSKRGCPAPRRAGDPEDRIWDAFSALLESDPGLRTRNCDLDREWDKLHYLLSATRRGEPASPADLAIDRAFDKGELIADHVQATQGVPVRYLSPGVVREIAELLAPIDHHALAAHYDPVQMEEAGVYKFSADQVDEDTWRWIVTSFDDLRRFFDAAAEAGDGAIVCLD